jgi:multiple sugar transport system permease protein
MSGHSKKIMINSVYYFFLILLSLFFIFPFVMMIFRSMMSFQDVNTLPVKFFPVRISAEILKENYSTILQPEYIRYLANSLFIAFFNTIAVPLSAAFCAFGFARCIFKGKNLIFSLILATIMLPGVVIQIPLFVMFYNYGLHNTPWPLTLPNLFGGGALNIFLIRQFMRGIPKDIDNSAQIDGANYFQIFFKIIFPVCIPIIIYIGVSVFIASWNDFMGPLIYLKDKSIRTLAIAFYYEFGKEGKYDFILIFKWQSVY